MRFQTLNKKEKSEFEDNLKENYGIVLPRCQLIKAGNEKIRLFTGDFSEHELNILAGLTRVETVGTYFAQTDVDNIRLGFDSCSLFKSSKNIIELDEEQAKKWFQGYTLEINTEEQSYVLLKFNGIIIGCGKATGKNILNFVPKERRISNPILV